MAEQAGLNLTLSKPPEDRISRVEAQISPNLQSTHECWYNKKVIEWLNCTKDNPLAMLVDNLTVYTHKPRKKLHSFPI